MKYNNEKNERNLVSIKETTQKLIADIDNKVDSFDEMLSVLSLEKDKITRQISDF